MQKILELPTVKEQSILIGLCLSKYNHDGLKLLGFTSFAEAFNVLGFALGVKPNSIKNYRDEFDPIFPNSRKGWHKREMRENCKAVYEAFNGLNLPEFFALIKTILYKKDALEQSLFDVAEDVDVNDSFAKRLLTGQAAENYFEENFKVISEFKSYELENTTKLGCGFDFKLHKDNDYIGVEVKGMNELNGRVQLTEKEYRVANFLNKKYFLFIVKNFKEVPCHAFYQDPINLLSFNKIERKIIQTSWNTNELL